MNLNGPKHVLGFKIARGIAKRAYRNERHFIHPEVLSNVIILPWQNHVFFVKVEKAFESQVLFIKRSVSLSFHILISIALFLFLSSVQTSRSRS